MLHRKEEAGVILISQPAHAWVSGQIVRKWGNASFAAASEEVCFATEQHDIGFLQWERSPTLNPETGLPHTFLEMPLATHLELWTLGIQQMLRYGRYPALLVSLHFTPLARMISNRNGASREKIAQWLSDQEALQRTLTTSLANDYHYAVTTEENILQDRDLLSLADWMSLQVCMNCQEESLLKQMPYGSPPGAIAITRCETTTNTVEVKPWPFRSNAVEVICEGRRLLRRFTDEGEMREAVRAAAPITLTMKLVPAPG